MTIEQAVVEKLRALPPEQQEKVLEFVETLQPQSPTEKRPLRSVAGLWSDLDIDLTNEDIDEARREMWGNFPRDDF